MAPLRVLQGDGPTPGQPPPLFRTSRQPASFEFGFHLQEEDDHGPFRWMSERGVLGFGPADGERFLEFLVLSEFRDLSQVLEVESGDRRLTLPLLEGWAPLSVPVPAAADRVSLAANKLYPPAYYPNDPRRLSVRVRDPRVHGDPARHAHILRQHENAVRNLREMLAGATRLESTAPVMGIDLHGACNIDPPCVYCEWDANKALEGDNVDVPFTRRTLEEWGEFFDNSARLVNCGIGEPFLMRNLDELLDLFAERGKYLEMATNGQILTDRNIQKLLGREVHLYISLDAATAETYARLRNRHFDKILDNLRRLIAAKGGRQGLPRVFLVFMPMRANQHELDAFVELCADLGVDRMVLRPLNDSFGLDLDWERAGYHFEYQKEILPFAELVRASGRAAGLCRAHDVELSNQLDFGGTMEAKFARSFEEARQAGLRDGTLARRPRQRSPESAGEEQTVVPATPESAAPLESGPPRRQHGGPATPTQPPAGGPLPSLGGDRLPLCIEPWSRYYILRRGVVPCCYGSSIIGEMQDYRQAWNSSLMQEIRGELAAGRLHSYCIHSPACPIVRKSEHARELSQPDARRLRIRRLWYRFDRALWGVPRAVYGPLKRTALRLRGIDPAARRFG